MRPSIKSPKCFTIRELRRLTAILADLGISSDQLDDPNRGLSFQHNAPLDMRMDPTRGETAADLLRRLPERDLADLIYQFGEERFSRRIARRIVEAREREPIATTGQLADLVRRCVPRGRSPIDPATRTFQALRIAVNDELESLDRLLALLPLCLKPGGRAVVISFHSLEDRRVKQAFRDSDGLDRADEEAGDGRRGRRANEPAVPQRQVAGRPTKVRIAPLT